MAMTSEITTSVKSVDSALFILRILERRDAAFGCAVMSDVVWTIVLQLYVDHHNRRKRSVSSLIRITGAPKSSVLRWLDTLSDRQIITRERDPDDTRRTFVILTSDTTGKLSTILTPLVSASNDHN